MTVDVECRGRRRVVELERRGEHWFAVVDGRATSVNLVPAGGHWSVLVGPAASPAATGPSPFAGTSARSYEVAVEVLEAGRYRVHVDGRTIDVAVVDPRRSSRGAAARSRDADGPEEVVAPMPGRIVKVLVSPGDVVSARQGLVVIEAMKMENEVRAARGGTIAEVRVREGQLVEASAVLVVVGPR